jgi:hypothetical protein
MKTKIFFLSQIVFLLMVQICIASTPHEISGFILGKSIDDYRDKVRLETALPIRYCEYLQEVEIKVPRGIKTGQIWYAADDTLHPIVRIKLKYADSSKYFYLELFRRFKRQFGEPTEWRGDPFHIVEGWKWSFTDEKNNIISLILQHNTLDRQQKIGNCVKLTNWSLLNMENRHFQLKHPKILNKKKKEILKIQDYRLSNWKQLIPH